MAGKRSYDDGCAAAHGLEIVGERWALLVVRELIYGPKRFSDLRGDLRSISPNVLTQRLSELEDAKVLIRRRLPPPAASWVYELTPWGKGLKPIIMALGMWASKSDTMPQDRPISAASLMLSLETTFRPDLARGMKTTIDIVVDGQSYSASVADGTLAIASGSDIPAEVTIASSAPLLDRFFYKGADLTKDENIQLSGRLDLLIEFSRLFRTQE